ncbi:hypothetical protein U1Q18_047759 [Sarracenia purpurea var. burkii]
MYFEHSERGIGVDGEINNIKYGEALTVPKNLARAILSLEWKFVTGGSGGIGSLIFVKCRLLLTLVIVERGIGGLGGGGTPMSTS